jgi:hypothetical protein
MKSLRRAAVLKLRVVLGEMGMFNPPHATGTKILFKNPEEALRPREQRASQRH